MRILSLFNSTQKITVSSEITANGQGHVYWQWIIAIIANTAIISYGLDVGWISPMAKLLQSDSSPAGEPLSDLMLSWIASIICITAGISSPLYAYVADAYGRKNALMSIAILQALTWLIRILYTSGIGMLISRSLSGLACGGSFNVIPMYIKEISQDNIRGTLGSMLVISQNIGILLVYIMGVYLEFYTIMWIAMGIPVVICFVLTKTPESPAFLVKRGKMEEAVSTVALLRGLEENHEIVKNEVAAMKSEDEYFKSIPNLSLITILKNPVWRRAAILGVIMIVAQATNGAVAVITFAADILATYGDGLSVRPQILALSVPAVLILGSVTTMLTIDRIGRKPLKIIMHTTTACATCTIAVCSLLQQNGSRIPSWLPIASIIIVVWTFAAGISAIPSVVMTEMFNFQIRAKLLGTIMTFAWFLCFVTIVTYAPITHAFGAHTTFFCFTGINVFGVIFDVLFLPETKGKPVEEIEADLGRKLKGINEDHKNVT